jgi:hypothetical protein
MAIALAARSSYIDTAGDMDSEFHCREKIYQAGDIKGSQIADGRWQIGHGYFR